MMIRTPSLELQVGHFRFMAPSYSGCLTRNGLCVLFYESDELIEQNRSDGRIDQDEAQIREVEWEGIPELGFVPEVVSNPVGLNKH
jgi:hypothetical protein